MSRNLISRDPYNPMTVDCRDQRYVTSPNGQIRRLSPEGAVIPRVKMSKKERRKLREGYREVQSMGMTELANKIIETPVINPVQNSDPAEGEKA
jgi:hypothetical protein